MDADQRQVRSEESTFEESSQTWVNTTMYYLRSTVLGGQVMTELWADGAKTRTFVYAGGRVLAWQKFFGTAQAVEWEHRDASDASFRTTMVNGAAWRVRIAIYAGGKLVDVLGLAKAKIWPSDRVTAQGRWTILLWLALS